MKRAIVSLALAACAVKGWVEESASPEVSFRLEAPMKIIYSNNPEQIHDVDMCDYQAAPKALLKVDIGPGKYRNFWEYLNADFDKKTLGWAIIGTNTDTKNVDVKIHGYGECNSWVCGGTAIANMFNNYDASATPATATIKPGESYVFMRRDKFYTHGQINTGILDMTISGNMTIRHLTYRNFDQCDTQAEGEVYITRKEEDGEDEGSVYKGMMPYSHAIADGLDFVIPRGTAAGTTLNVRYQRYNSTTHMFGPAVENNRFVTNCVPNEWGDEMVLKDMVAIDIPGWGWLYPDRCCDARQHLPNYGNWGIEYHIEGSVRNDDVVSHTFAIGYGYPGCGSAAAYQANGGDNEWLGVFFTESSSEIYYVKKVVAPGETVPFAGKYMLGGPACGSEAHYIYVH